ncbi:Ubiquitin-protein ligase protein [Dioscorea alata]|uniref:Ubiquitin-protein ligase protein n=1 Tax=Dioscorea alata TaxID=55571 RepID=A0ACB7TRQ1_DIOAL|nr:Ubiquitin-protein ligase protein [Dioscorea alata]
MISKTMEKKLIKKLPFLKKLFPMPLRFPSDVSPMPSSISHPSPTIAINADDAEHPFASSQSSGMSTTSAHNHRTVDTQFSSLSSKKKRRRKRSEMVQKEVIQIESGGESDTDSVVFISAKSSDYKKKQPVVYVKDDEEEIKPNLAPERTVPCEQKEVVGEEIDINVKAFKQFDLVCDHSDHYYAKATVVRTRNWAKSIQNEWKVLENNLPETIFVRAFEDRMDILRAVIIGPDETPYHDGLFFFDIQFPANYPQSPPVVYYHSGGLRLNPNLYANGKVCLSLLNTWSGSGCELWKPSKSTMLQVLVSIQALILNSKPYFNEPGFSRLANTKKGQESSIAYNRDTFLSSCRTMLYSLRRPPKHFEDFVTEHFRNKGVAILLACKSYMEGALVGCAGKRDESCPPQFKSSLNTLFQDLRKEFMAKGVDCEQVCVAEMNGTDKPLQSALPQLPMAWTAGLPPQLSSFMPMPMFPGPLTDPSTNAPWNFPAFPIAMPPGTSLAPAEMSDFLGVINGGFPFT